VLSHHDEDTEPNSQMISWLVLRHLSTSDNCETNWQVRRLPFVVNVEYNDDNCADSGVPGRLL